MGILSSCSVSGSTRAAVLSEEDAERQILVGVEVSQDGLLDTHSSILMILCKD